MKHTVDIETWERRDNYAFFRNFLNSWISVATEIDCTEARAAAKAAGRSFFLYYLYAVLRAVNEIREFRYRTDSRGNVIWHDTVDVISPIAVPGRTFYTVRIPYHADFERFYAEARAIVTDIPGTTRDTVEEAVLCGGVLLRLIDTAGLRETEDEVERLGVERSRKAMEGAELILLVRDGSVEMCPENRAHWEAEALLLSQVARTGKPWLCVESKCDLTGPRAFSVGLVQEEANNPAACLCVSSVTGLGLDKLGEAVAALFPAGDPGEAGSLLTDRRQEDAARRARDALRRGRGALESGLTPDAVLADAEEALDAIGELTGRTAREEIVERIFSRFCVGK